MPIINDRQKTNVVLGYATDQQTPQTFFTVIFEIPIINDRPPIIIDSVPIILMLGSYH